MAKRNWLNGVVRWFDNHTGEGLIRGDGGRSFYVHYSTIQSSTKWKTLEKNQKVKFLLLEDPDFLQVEKVKSI